MSDQIQEFFADGVVDVSVANGVFRITFGQQDKDNKLRPVARALIPANQLGRSLSGISQAAKEIADKIKGAAAPKGGGKDKEPDTKKKK